jgi:thiol:disulfide interchange protein DsbA
VRNIFKGSVIKSLVVVAALLFGSTACSEEANQGYTMLVPAQPAGAKKIEVLEFFSYGCSHCYHLHHDLGAWAKKMPKDVELVYVPVIFRDSAEPLARTYYALESMPNFEKMHDAIYRGINVENRTVRPRFDLVFVKRGGSPSSPPPITRSRCPAVSRAKQMIRSYASRARRRWWLTANT